ncbi:MAG: Mrp/NBP35 family ATP-binding protein [Proteobacteria bacterium]|nr:Mrp/NBP35 family ATP-binding protein [Pseudomonadota bacterium]MBU1611193.1 Mrp/NBP35 family ATP-binding protein [Pseudomonadota bacterium]
MSDECGSCPSATPEGGCGSAAGCPSEADQKIEKTLSRIKHKIVVMSGKGGVGKSTVAVNLAAALAMTGKSVGLLDIDVHGPSVPRLLGLQDEKPHMGPDFMEPIPWGRNLWVMSLGFMLPNKEQAVIWRGPVKIGLIQQFIKDVAWGDLDYLIIDCPPGTGDEPMTALQTVGPEAKTVIVTTPQGVAVDDVRRSVSFVGEMGNTVLGIVENMSGFACPDCKSVHDIFGSGGGEDLAREMGVPFLGRIPIDPEVARSGDEGFVYVKTEKDSIAAKSMADIVEKILVATS